MLLNPSSMSRRRDDARFMPTKDDELVNDNIIKAEREHIQAVLCGVGETVFMYRLLWEIFVRVARQVMRNEPIGPSNPAKADLFYHVSMCLQSKSLTIKPD